MSTADKSKSYFPLAGSTSDGWSTEDEATATCFCGTVQLAFVSLLLILESDLSPDTSQPTSGPGLIDTFVCNCFDCRKITASMFASNFTVADTHLKHLRGQDNLSTFTQKRSIKSGNDMTNYFCKTCGGLMYRVSSGLPGQSILRIGTVDDFSLHETKLKPQIEQFVEARVGWLADVPGARQVVGMH